MSLPSSRLSFGEKVAYGFGDAASNLFWKTFTMFLMFFYTDVFGLTAASAGTMFLVTRIWDSLFDPLMGVLADRTNTRWGKFRPYLVWMAVPFGVFGVLTFTTPGFGPEGKLVYAYVTYTLMMLVYSAINVPYSALLGVISPDSQERTSASSYRFMFAFLGSLVVQFSMQHLVAGLGQGNEAQGYQRAAAVLSGAAVLLFLGCFAWTRERVAPAKVQSSLRADLADLGRNGPWMVLLALTLVTQIATCVRDGSILYYFKYYFGDAAGAANFMVAGSVASVVGIFLVQYVTASLGKRRTFALLLLGSALVLASTYWIRIDQLFAAYATHVAINLLMGPLFALISAMLADTVDYSEWKTGRRATGLVFSAWSMASKFGWAIGGALTGWVLALFGFQANEAASAETQQGIRIMMSLLPAGAALLGAVLVLQYKLDDTKVREIERELQSRRQSA